MKAKSAFDHPVSGQKVMPGQTIDEKGLDKEQLEELKTKGYAVDGDGYKAGEKPDFEKLTAGELTAHAQALGIDTGGLRDRSRIVGAINAKTAPAAPAGEQKQGAVTFGPGTRAHEEERTVAPEDYAKQQQDVSKARAESEKSMAQSAGNKEKAADAVKLADQAGKAKGPPPPERKPGAPAQK